MKHLAAAAPAALVDRMGDYFRGTAAAEPASELARYRDAVKRSTNQEIAEQLEGAVQAMAPAGEMDDAGWMRIRILLDEFRWRLSALE